MSVNVRKCEVLEVGFPSRFLSSGAFCFYEGVADKNKDRLGCAQFVPNRSSQDDSERHGMKRAISSKLLEMH